MRLIYETCHTIQSLIELFCSITRKTTKSLGISGNIWILFECITVNMTILYYLIYQWIGNFTFNWRLLKESCTNDFKNISVFSTWAIAILKIYTLKDYLSVHDLTHAYNIFRNNYRFSIIVLIAAAKYIWIYHIFLFQVCRDFISW
jgi:hypothetical protein